MEGLGQNFFVFLFCFAGSSLTVVNKELVSGYFPYPGTLTFVQCLFAATFLQFGRIFIPSVEKNVQSINIETAKKWSILVLLFVLMLLSSMFALEKISVTTLTVVRNLTTLTTATCDFFFLNTTFTLNRVLCLVAMLVGACMYGLHDMSFHAVGYLFLVANCVATTMYQIKVKVLVRELELSALSMSYYNNVLCLPALSAIVLLSGEVKTVIPEQLNLSRHCVLLISISSVLGFTLSITAFKLNQLVSATTIMVINNASKFLLIVYSEVFMTRSLGNLSALGCAIVLTSSFLYSWLPNEVSSGITPSPTAETVISSIIASNNLDDDALNFMRMKFIAIPMLATTLFIFCFSNVLKEHLTDLVFKFKDQPNVSVQRWLGYEGSKVLFSQDTVKACEKVSEFEGLRRISIPFSEPSKQYNTIKDGISTHHCIGDNSLVRSCIFWHVLFDIETGRLKYLRDSTKFGFGIHSLNNPAEPILSISAVLTRNALRDYGLFVDELDIDKNEMILAEAHEMGGTNLLFREHAADNFGHFLLDNLYVAYATLKNLGIDNLGDAQLLLRAYPKRGRKRLDESWSPLFNQKPIIMDDKIMELKSQGVKFIHFHSLVAGGPYGLTAGLHSVHSRLMKKPSMIDFKDEKSYKFATGKNFNRADQILKLRKITMRNLGIDSDFVPNSHLLVIINKEGRRRIQNIEPLEQHLRKIYPNITVTVINPAKFSLREQMLLMSKTTLLITPRGGISFIGMYQSPGAFSICLESPAPEWRITEYEYFWQNLNYLKQIMYPVNMQDVKCSLNQKLIDLCDINVNLDKMANLVNQALYEMSFSSST